MVSMLRHIDKQKNQGVAVRHDKGVDFSMGQHSSSIYIWIVISISLGDMPELIYFYQDDCC